MADNQDYPFKWVANTQEFEDKKKKLFGEGTNQLNGVISEPWGMWMPYPMAKDWERIYNFKIRPDDIWLLAYPKCGTTWTQVS